MQVAGKLLTSVATAAMVCFVSSPQEASAQAKLCGRSVKIVADAGQCAAVAARLHLPAIASLQASLLAAPFGKDGISVKGEIASRLTQTCVVTSEDFESDIVAPVDIRFSPDGVDPNADIDLAELIEEGGEDPPDLLVDGRIDLGAVITEFFDRNWIDAELRDGKRGGAFSSSAVPSVHPYILLNFTDRVRDVMTLAHELGHGLHQYLSRGQGYLQCDTPLTTAEMASVFGEMLTFRRLQERYPEPKQRLAMLCGKIEDAFATVFRQVVLTRFEQSLHAAREKEGELSPDAIDALWMKANQAMMGDVVTFTPGYASWWSYIGHFIRSPFYCYAYSFGELLVLALFQKYKEEGDAFVPKYLELLSSGGSDAPHRLLAKLGVDVTDPTFWELGLRLLGDMVAEAERMGQVN